MYIKISKKSQLITLRELNPFLGKHRLPEEVLHELGKLKKNRCRSKEDFIALFLHPVKNDTAEILGGLQLYPMKPEFDDDNLYMIPTRGKKKVVWTCSEIRLKERNQKIFAVYPMKIKDLDAKGGD